MEKLLVLLFPFLCLQLLTTVDAGGSIDVILSGSQLPASFMSNGASSLVKQNSGHLAVSKKKHSHGTSLHLVKNSSRDKKSMIVAKSASREQSPAVETDLELFRSSGKHVNGVKQRVQMVERSGDTHVLKTLDLPLESDVTRASNVNDKQGESAVAHENHVKVETKDIMTTLGQYLDKMVAHYDRLGKRVPAQAIAKIMLRMHNELSFNLERVHSTLAFKVEMDQPLTLQNFRLDKPKSSENGDDLSMDGTVHINFSADESNNFESFVDMGLDNMLLMSPEKIKRNSRGCSTQWHNQNYRIPTHSWEGSLDMRLKSANADMTWLFGSVMHFLMYGSYPLKAWEGVKLLDEKYRNQLQQSENADDHDKLQKEFVNELRAEVQKMLENGQPLPLRDESQSFNKHFQLLSTVMKECLEIDPKKRLGVQYVGGRLLKLAAGLLPWS